MSSSFQGFIHIFSKNKHLSFFLIFAWLSIPARAQDSDFHLDEVYSIDKSGTLALSSDDADVFISGTTRSDVHVKIDRVVKSKGIQWGEKHFDVIIKEDNGDLRIEDKEWGSQSGIMGFTTEEYVIKIEIPETVSLNIIGDDDDYDITNIFGSIRMKVDDGDIRLENCLSSSYSFDLDDGDILINGATGNLRANLDDGNLRVLSGKFKNIDVKGDDADFDIETTLDDQGDYTFRIEDASVDLLILGGGGYFIIRHDDGHISADRSFILEEEDEDYTEYKLPGGNSKILVTGDDLSVRLKSTTTN